MLNFLNVMFENVYILYFYVNMLVFNSLVDNYNITIKSIFVCTKC